MKENERELTLKPVEYRFHYIRDTLSWEGINFLKKKETKSAKIKVLQFSKKL